ncbi:sodium channel subunit beta-2 isoform X2 [Callorhinchus milii]|nr:sodium channel subunit beta-2 isoform X2 [Callorhinchus milii]
MRVAFPPSPSPLRVWTRGFLLVLLSSAWVNLCFSMEVTVPATIIRLNGTSVKLSCTFNSCYKVDNKQFTLNWTYQECSNCTEELFALYRRKIIILKTEQFWDRVEWSGNPNKNDASVTIHELQLSDEGYYNCHVLNPPDRHKGLGTIYLSVVTEEPPKRDSTVAVIVGSSIGGSIAALSLTLVAVKCVRRKKKQDLQSEDQKMEEEGKTEGEENEEEGTK